MARLDKLLLILDHSCKPEQSQDKSIHIECDDDVAKPHYASAPAFSPVSAADEVCLEWHAARQFFNLERFDTAAILFDVVLSLGGGLVYLRETTVLPFVLGSIGHIKYYFEYK